MPPRLASLCEVEELTQIPCEDEEAAPALRRARVPIRGFATPTPSAELKKTGLYDFHVAQGAKMVPFAGYAMPLVYGDVGQVASHKHVRTEAGLFDVGHMVQSLFHGPTATPFLEWLTPSSLAPLAPYSSTLSVLLNEKGGIIDDLMITKHAEDAYYVVTNAGRRERDLAWFPARLDEWNAGEQGKAGQVEMTVLEKWGLLALQGAFLPSFPPTILLTSFDLSQLTFGKSAFVPVEGFNLHVARGGYTGEDGFEVRCAPPSLLCFLNTSADMARSWRRCLPPPSQTAEVAALLLGGEVQLTGLGARDSLRLEAGLCLYGTDLDEETGPVEAGLAWVVGKDRRETGTFIGADGVRQQLKEVEGGVENGIVTRRVGLVVEGAVARGSWCCFSLPSFIARTGFLLWRSSGDFGAMDFDFASVEFLRTRPDLIGDMAFAVTVERVVEADGKGAKIVDPATNDVLGAVTSGIPSPTLGTNIAMGYVRSGAHKKGTQLGVEVRGVKVVGMPFVGTRYWRGCEW
ncbi:hypothetical protein B0H14DRAFT_3556709 [Mycena olivaceomarginata]|nr:hypothetical protein B0H14DRAFT_3556709 [Mycena olivaceomarginata]